MTSSQVTAVLSDLGYSPNTLLELKEVSEIVLISDENIYPDENIRIMLDTANELILVFGKDPVSGEYTKRRTTIEMKAIVAFMLSPVFMKSPYKMGSQV